MHRFLGILALLACFVPAPGRAEGVPLPGEERSSIAPLEAGVGYSPGYWYPANILRLGYTFRPTYAVTANYSINKIDYYHQPFDPGYLDHDLRLGIQASSYVWEDLEMLISGFQRIHLANRVAETLVRCGQGYCRERNGIEWSLDPAAATGMQWGVRFWIFPRFSVLVLDGMEWHWEREEWESSQLAFLFGVHF